MKIFVTGNRGYIGAHLVDVLKKDGHFVTGCDLNLFSGCEWNKIPEPDIQLLKDIRSLTTNDLSGYDCVMHLAAISNDPMGELVKEITYDVNYKGSVHVAETAKKAGVQRFLFASSCSMYGKGETLDLDETSKLNPVSVYAQSKIEAERDISLLADENFSPAFLRNSTAYGYSPMLRIDLVVNNLLGCAVTRGDIRIMSDGTPWRPLIHCRDIANAFNAFLKAPREVIHNKAVNIGDNKENFQVKDVADLVQKFVPSAKIIFTGEVGEDPRNYRVKFDMLNKLLPDFKLEYTLSKGMEELNRWFNEKQFSLSDFEGEKYVRLRTLRHRLDLLEKGNG